MDGSQRVTADAEQVLDRAVDGREALELPCGVEAAHLPFALSRRFVRDLGSVVGVRVRAVDDRGHHRAAGSSFAYSATCGLNLTKPFETGALIRIDLTTYSRKSLVQILERVQHHVNQVIRLPCFLEHQEPFAIREDVVHPKPEWI